MKSYYVMWEIELDAENPRDAARQALEIQRDPRSIATIFNVTEEDSDAAVAIDLSDGD